MEPARIPTLKELAAYCVWRYIAYGSEESIPEQAKPIIEPMGISHGSKDERLQKLSLDWSVTIEICKEKTLFGKVLGRSIITKTISEKNSSKKRMRDWAIGRNEQWE